MVLFIWKDSIDICLRHSAQLFLRRLFPLPYLSCFIFEADDGKHLFQPPGAQFDSCYQPGYLLVQSRAGNRTTAGADTMTPRSLLLPVERSTTVAGLRPHRHPTVGAADNAFQQVLPFPLFHTAIPVR